MQIENEIFPEIELRPGEKFTDETADELSNGKGDDEDE